MQESFCLEEEAAAPKRERKPWLRLLLYLSLAAQSTQPNNKVSPSLLLCAGYHHFPFLQTAENLEAEEEQQLQEVGTPSLLLALSDPKGCNATLACIHILESQKLQVQHSLLFLMEIVMQRLAALVNPSKRAHSREQESGELWLSRVLVQVTAHVEAAR